MDEEVREMVRSMTAAVVMRRRCCPRESSSDPDSDSSTNEFSCTPRMDRVLRTHHQCWRRISNCVQETYLSDV